MNFIDLFAGVGGFRKGLEDAGHHCVGFCEVDKYAIASYTAMHLITEEQRQHLLTLDKRHRLTEILKEEYRNGEWFIDDIRAVNATNIPRADLWCFGAPCQDFSIANINRDGLGGDRSSLVREVFRILGEMDEEDRPKWILYENVKGMLSSNKGHDFLEILVAMDELGYDAQWQVLNSKHFGVPQNRERVYTLGHLRRYGRVEVFPLTGTDREDTVPMNVIQVNELQNNHQAGRVYDTGGVSPSLTDMQGGGREPRIITDEPVAIPVLTPYRPIKRQNGRRMKENNEDAFTVSIRDINGVAVKSELNPEVIGGVGSMKSNNGTQFYQQDRVYDSTKVATALTDSLPHGVNMYGIPVRNATEKGYEVAELGDSVSLAHAESKTRRGRVGKQIANTLDTDSHQGVVARTDDHKGVGRVWYEKQHCYISIRRLTPRECFRLQGWDDYHFDRAEMVNSDAQLYKQAGNGVTVNVVRVIGELLREQEEQHED